MKYTVEEVFEKWRIQRRPILSWAAFNAFDLRCHPERGKTHVFYVNLVENGTKIGRREKGKKTNAITVADTMFMDRATLQGYDPLSWNLVEMQERENAKVEEDQRVVSPTVFRYGFARRLVYLMWFDQEILDMQKNPHWRAVLQSVMDGKDEFEVVQGNPVRKGMPGAFYSRISLAPNNSSFLVQQRLQGCDVRTHRTDLVDIWLVLVWAHLISKETTGK
jgi:hypothetical protein